MNNLPPVDDPTPGRTPSNAEDTESSQQKLHRMLAAIWERSKTTIEERVAILREAERLSANRTLDEPARLRAVDAAHKLAGVLGTFDLPRGTDLAREAEETFGKQTILNHTELLRLQSVLEELEVLVKTPDAPAGADSSRDHKAELG